MRDLLCFLVNSLLYTAFEALGSSETALHDAVKLQSILAKFGACPYQRSLDTCVHA